MLFQRRHEMRTPYPGSLLSSLRHNWHNGFPDICTKDVADCWKHDIGNGRQLFWVSVADVITEVSFITSAHLIWPLNHLNMDLCCTGQSLSMYAAWSSPECSGRYFSCQQHFFQFCPIKIVWVDGWWRDKVLIPVGLSDLLSFPQRSLLHFSSKAPETRFFRIDSHARFTAIDDVCFPCVAMWMV